MTATLEPTTTASGLKAADRLLRPRDVVAEGEGSRPCKWWI